MSKVPFISFSTTAKVVQMSGDSHSCALFNDNTVKCWGNSYPWQPFTSPIAQITDTHDALTVSGSIVNFTTVAGKAIESAPLMFSDPLIVAIQLATSPRSAEICAIFGNSRMRCWPSVASAAELLTTPYLSFLETNAQAFSTSKGSDFTCVLMLTGSIKCWGGNARGQLGTGNIVNVPASQIPTLGNIVFGDSIPAVQLAGETATSAHYLPMAGTDAGERPHGQLVGVRQIAPLVQCPTTNM